MRRATGWVLFSLIASTEAWGQAGTEAEAESEAEDLQIHGFVSQGFMATSHGVNYLTESSRGSFELGEVGVNFTRSLGDRLKAGVQLFARDLGPIGDYSITADWYYLDYRWRDWLGVRAGRNKLPFGLYNDSSDADSARVAVLLPQSVYPTEERDFFLAQTGVELYGYLGLGRAGALDYRLHAGTIFFDEADPPGARYERLRVPYMAGGRVLWETPLVGLRVGASAQAARVRTDLVLEGTAPETVVGLENPVVLWVASLEYARDALVLAAEYGRWHIRLESTDPTIIPDSAHVSEVMYGMATYRLTGALQLGAYYSLFFADVDLRSGRENRQHDVAGTLRIDLSEHWLLKLEAHYMDGTYVLIEGMNDAPLDQLDRRWAVFMAKTTAYF